MLVPFSLFNTAPTTPFPDVHLALKDPNGLLAIGGDLNATRLINAYKHGVFPWYSEDQPVLWWCPDPRLVLFPDKIHLSKSLKKSMKRHNYRVTMDHAFEQVILECAAPRPDQNGTWITAEIIQAYTELHKLGYAHSVEVWDENRIIGGLYGVAIGKIFFGESMFSRHADTSKIAFAHLANTLHKWQFQLIDCQVETAHLKSLGAENISRTAFIDYLEKYCSPEVVDHHWKMELSLP